MSSNAQSSSVSSVESSKWRVMPPTSGLTIACCGWRMSVMTSLGRLSHPSHLPARTNGRMTITQTRRMLRARTRAGNHRMSSHFSSFKGYNSVVGRATSPMLQAVFSGWEELL
ncbi:plant intracellular ras group-related LRR 1 [Striga asiatica]|uniref:Plant intracellular ras group-related LRR 1 n=1 Tax=Striga asiatica TaxID=4170 RepID=A0A5A7QUT2_STRAF|nr:plant intracellular ras group-related LRR 1 [Striga asiatica]